MRCCSTALTDVHKRHLSSVKLLLLSGFASKAIAHVKGSFCEKLARMCCKKIVILQGSNLHLQGSY